MVVNQIQTKAINGPEIKALVCHHLQTTTTISVHKKKKEKKVF